MRLLTGVPASASARLRFPRVPFARSSSRSMVANSAASSSSSAAASSSSSSSAAVYDGDGGAARKPWLFVGLGNPGRMYKGTRHNVGFDLIDAIAEAEGIPISSKHFKSMVGKGLIGDVPVMLAKPQTFMNASGESVGQLVSYFKIPLNQVVVIYDDLDLPFAKLRLLPKGGHGGHNGMRSVIHHFKESRDFPRLRIGIGRPTGMMPTAIFVLRSFTEEEQKELDSTFVRCLQAVRIMLLEGFNKSAIFVNTPASPQPPETLNRPKQSDLDSAEIPSTEIPSAEIPSTEIPSAEIPTGV